METLVQNLRTALKARIEKLDWMSDETKQKALAKWASFTPKIGYPDKWRDWSGLATSRDSYIGNVLAANEFNYKWELGKIGKPVDKTEWGMTPADGQRLLQPAAERDRVPGRDPAAAVLRSERRRRDELRRHRRGDRPRDDPRLRRPGQPLRTRPATSRTGGRRPMRKGFEARTDKLVEQFNGYEALPGPARQRQADARREHRRPRRPQHRLRRDEGGDRRHARPDDRRLQPRPALLPQLRHDLARPADAGLPEGASSTPTRMRRATSARSARRRTCRRSRRRSSARRAIRWCGLPTSRS